MAEYQYGRNDIPVAISRDGVEKEAGAGAALRLLMTGARGMLGGATRGGAAASRGGGFLRSMLAPVRSVFGSKFVPTAISKSTAKAPAGMAGTVLPARSAATNAATTAAPSMGRRALDATGRGVSLVAKNPLTWYLGAPDLFDYAMGQGTAAAPPAPQAAPAQPRVSPTQVQLPKSFRRYTGPPSAATRQSTGGTLLGASAASTPTGRLPVPEPITVSHDNLPYGPSTGKFGPISVTTSGNMQKQFDRNRALSYNAGMRALTGLGSFIGKPFGVEFNYDRAKTPEELNLEEIGRRLRVATELEQLIKDRKAHNAELDAKPALKAKVSTEPTSMTDDSFFSELDRRRQAIRDREWEMRRGLIKSDKDRRRLDGDPTYAEVIY